MSITEIIAERLIGELIIFFKGNTDSREKLDKIAFKVSRSLPLTVDEQYFMEMKVPETLSKAFWEAVKNSSTELEFLETYKKGVI